MLRDQGVPADKANKTIVVRTQEEAGKILAEQVTPDLKKKPKAKGLKKQQKEKGK